MSTIPQVEAEMVARSMVIDPPMTDAQLFRFCQINESLRVERTSEGEIRMNPPAGFLTSDGNSEIAFQLRTWWREHQWGRVADSSAGFFLPDGSMLSPDAAYILPDQLAGLTRDDLTGFPYLCPAFVIELLSPSDSLAAARQKMQSWIANGAKLAWLIDPNQQCVFVYQPGCEPQTSTTQTLKGSGPVEGFVMDLGKVWRCYQV